MTAPADTKSLAAPNPPLAAPGANTIIDDAMSAPFDIANAVERLKRIEQFFKEVMHEGEDYGPAYPGSKAVILYRAGGDRFCQFLGVYARPAIEEKIEQWALDGGKPFFMFNIRTELVAIRTGHIVAVGMGTCNSMEVKYRYRTAQRECPNCGASSIMRSSYPKEIDGRPTEPEERKWYCNRNKGGCGDDFPPNDERLTSQEVGRSENTEIHDLHHTIMRVAKKRANSDAIVSVARAAGFLVEAVKDDDDDDQQHQGGRRGAGGKGRDQRRGASDQGKGDQGKDSKPPEGPAASDEQATELKNAMERNKHPWPMVCAWVKKSYGFDLTRHPLPASHFGVVFNRLDDPTPITASSPAGPPPSPPAEKKDAAAPATGGEAAGKTHDGEPAPAPATAEKPADANRKAF